MSRLEQAKSTAFELWSLSRTGRRLPRFVSNRPWSASRLLDERVAENPNGLALAYLDERYTWRDLDLRVNQYARFFQSRGIGSKDVVALFMDNRPEFLFAALGLNRLCAVASLINTNASGIALTHAITVCKAKAVLFGSEHAEAMQDVRSALAAQQGRLWMQVDKGAEPAHDFERINEAVAQQSGARPPRITLPNTSDVMCYIYTSGTTGLPKAAIVTNKRFMSGAYLYGASCMEATSRDVIYVTLPLYHANAFIIGFGSALGSGAAIALRRRFSASQFWEDVYNYDASIFVYIGELCRYLLNAPKHPRERSHRLRVAVGNGLRTDVWEAFQRRFNMPLFREFYMATESNAPIVNFEGRPGLLGRLNPGQVLARCDEASGEVFRNAQGFCEQVDVGQKGILLGRISPLIAFDGYVDRSASEKKVMRNVFRQGDAYFNTGDLLERHADGWVSFADRVGDTFRWKGENVSTNEVAEVLNGAKGVLESNVYGVAVPGSEGRAGMASINANPELDLGEFARYVVDRLPAYQRPYFLRLQQEMRITGTFKHQKLGYRDEGFDPNKVSDPLFFLDGETYVRIDQVLFQRIQAGEVGPR
ncbi:MAG: long-chain-acyl-CoA synthetase [Myxococcales bacterium]